MASKELFADELSRPATGIALGFSQRLAELCPDRAVLESAGSPFNLIEFEAGGDCKISLNPEMHSQLLTEW